MPHVAYVTASLPGETESSNSHMKERGQIIKDACFCLPWLFVWLINLPEHLEEDLR